MKSDRDKTNGMETNAYKYVSTNSGCDFILDENGEVIGNVMKRSVCSNENKKPSSSNATAYLRQDEKKK
jgi:apolipoprotein N-acyltransferase